MFGYVLEGLREWYGSGRTNRCLYPFNNGMMSTFEHVVKSLDVVLCCAAEVLFQCYVHVCGFLAVIVFLSFFVAELGCC